MGGWVCNRITGVVIIFSTLCDNIYLNELIFQRSTSSSGSRNLDLRQVKLAMTQQARRAASGGRVSVLRADNSRVRQKPQAPNAEDIRKTSEVLNRKQK